MRFAIYRIGAILWLLTTLSGLAQTSRLDYVNTKGIIARDTNNAALVPRGDGTWVAPSGTGGVQTNDAITVLTNNAGYQTAAQVDARVTLGTNNLASTNWVLSLGYLTAESDPIFTAWSNVWHLTVAAALTNVTSEVSGLGFDGNTLTGAVTAAGYVFGNTNAPAGTVWTNNNVVLVGTNDATGGGASGDLSFTNATFILLGSSPSTLPNARVLDSAPDLLPTTADPWDEEFSDQSFTNRFSTRSGETPVWKFGSGTAGLRITNATAYLVCTKAAPTGSAPWFVSAKLTGAMGGGYRGFIGLALSNASTNDYLLGYYGLGGPSDNHPVIVRLNTNGSYNTAHFGEGQAGTGLPIYWAVGYDGTNTHVYTSGLGGIWQRLTLNNTLPFRPSAIGIGGYTATATYTNHAEIDWLRVTYGGLP